MEHDKFRELVDAEYEKQDHRYDALHCDHFWLGLIVEEVGEVAQAVNKGDKTPIDELVQISALIESWVKMRN